MQAAEANSNTQQTVAVLEETERELKARVSDARAQQEADKWRHEDELRRMREEAEASRREFERRGREAGQRFEAQRLELIAGHEAALRAKDSELQRVQAEGHNRVKDSQDEVTRRQLELETRMRSEHRLQVSCF